MKAIHLMAAGLALALLPLGATAADRGARRNADIVTGDPVLAPGDFNNDGNPDLLWQNYASGNLRVWFLERTRPFASSGLSDAVDPAFTAFGARDFDRDGRTDVLFWNPSNSHLLVWYMRGTSLLRKSEIDLSIPDYSPVSVVDFNNDGNLDIVFQRDRGIEIQVALFEGETVIDKFAIDLAQAGSVLDWRVLGTSDFDRDGDADLVLFHSGTRGSRETADDTLAVALMDGAVGSIRVITPLTDRNWQVRAVADFTRDGWPDLFWENYATGETGVWEMVGLKIAAQYVVTKTPESRGWHIMAPR